MEESRLYAKNEGVHTDFWEQDLKSAISIIEEERVLRRRYAIVMPSVREELGDKHMVDDIVPLIYCMLNGFSNLYDWENMRNNRYSLPYPHKIKRQAWSIDSSGYLKGANIGVKASLPTSDNFTATLGIRGLGITTDDGDIVRLRKESFLDVLIPNVLTERGDAIISLTTYCKQGQSTLGRKSQLLSERSRVWGKTGIVNLGEAQVKESAPMVNYLNGFVFGLDLCRSLGDPIVKVSNQLIVQSPSEQGAKTILENLIERLHVNSIGTISLSKRHDQLMGLRSGLPLIQKEDIDDLAVPKPLRMIDLHTEGKLVSEEGKLEILIGKTVPLGEPYFLPFGDNAVFLAGQTSGKTGALIMISIRLLGMLPKDSVVVFYDGTDIREEQALSARYGLQALARVENATMNIDGINDRLKGSYGVMYGDRYDTAEDVYNDFFDLINRGVRFLVFSSVNRVHLMKKTETGFFDAVEQNLRYRKPGALIVDETSKMAHDERARKLFVEIAPTTTKSNTMFIWTGQTTLDFPDKPPKSVRMSALSNTFVTFLGPTTLIRNIPDEVMLNVALFEKEATWLSQKVAEATYERIPGTFFAVRAAGYNVVPIRVIPGLETLDIIMRKDKEMRIRYGL